MGDRRTAIALVIGVAVGALATVGLVQLLDENGGQGGVDGGDGVAEKPQASSRDAPDVYDQELQPAPEGDCNISGTVRDSEGNPIPGAQIRLRLLDSPWPEADVALETASGDDGAYELEGLSEDRPLQVWAWAPGKASSGLGPARCDGATDPTLEPGGSLTASFTTGEGDPPGRLRVLIAGGALWPQRSALTARDGTLALAGLAPGIYALWAYDGERAVVTGRPSEVAAGETARLEARLEPASEAQVRTVDAEGGDPIPNATVLIAPVDSPVLRRTGVTGKDGSTSFAGLSPGAYTVEAVAPGYLRTAPVALDPEGESVLRLRSGARVRGTVRDPDGNPVSGALVEVSQELGGAAVMVDDGRRDLFLSRMLEAARHGWPIARPGAEGDALLVGPQRVPLPAGDHESPGRAVTDESGSFELDGLPSGRLQITASHPELIMERPTRITLPTGGEMKEIAVAMRPGTALFVRTVNEKGYPVREAEISVYSEDGELLAETSSGGDGTAELRGLPGSARVEALAEGRVPAAARIDGRPGRRISLELELPLAAESIRGRLVDSRGYGIKEARITARSMARGTIQVVTAITEKDGTFALEGVGECTYHVVAEKDGKVLAQAPKARFDTEVQLVSDEEGGIPFDRFVLPSGPIGPALREPEQGNEGSRAIALSEPSPSAAGMDSEYGSVDRLPVTGPPPGKGGLPIQIGGGPGKVVVRNVSAGSHVAVAGLEEGDRILTVDGKKVRTPAQARKAISGPIGSVVMLGIAHGKEKVTLVVQRVRIH
ncbi:MAG: carboxypeptidase regulatory-like domain-containing protein [Polyangia bacterium]